MMVACIVLLVLGAISLALFLIEKVRKYSIKETVIKGVTSVLFIALAVVANIHNGFEDFGVFAIIGLSFGLIGDIFLDLKYVDLKHTRFHTFAGFIAFAFGHICYIGGIVLTLPYPNLWYSYIGPLVFGLLCGVLVLVLEKPLKFNYGEYKWISFIYAIFLFTTVGTTFYLALVHKMNITTYNMLFIAACLFAVSDLILCGTYFGEGRERPVDIVSNAVTYYAAQYLIALSLYFLVI